MPIKSAIKIVIFVFLILACVMNTAELSAQNEDAVVLFKRGIVLFKQDKLVSARLDFKDIIDNYSSSEYVVPSHMMLAKTYFNLGDFELTESTAVEHRVLYTASPYFEWTYYLSAACKFKMGEYGRAASILSELASQTNNAVLKARALSTIKYVIMPVEGSESIHAILSSDGIDPSGLDSIKPFEAIDNTAVVQRPSPPRVSQNTPRNTTQPQPRKVRNTINTGSSLKIGVLTPLTGIHSDMGNALLEGIRSAMANNPLAGERKIELIVEDTGSSAVAAVIKTRKLAGEGVIAIIGPVLSESTIPAAVESQSHGIPFIAPTTTTIDFTRIGNYVFQLNFNPIIQAEALAELAYDTLNFTNFAVIADNDPWGIAVAETVSKEMEKRGAVNIWSDYIVEDLSTSSDELFTQIRDGAPQSSASTDSMVIYNYGTAFPDTVYITQEVLLSEERRPMPIDTIDCIFVSAASEEAIRVASLIMEYNIRTVILGDSGWWSNRRAFRGNERYLEGAIIVSSDSELSGGTEPSYIPSVSETPDPNNLLFTKGADSCRLIIHCLQNGADDPDKLVEMLESIKEFQGLSSGITIDPSRHTNTEVSFIQVRGGKNYAITNDTIFNQIKTFTEDSFDTEGAALPISQ
jgi:hypothetical protein